MSDLTEARIREIVNEEVERRLRIMLESISSWGSALVLNEIPEGDERDAERDRIIEIARAAHRSGERSN